MADDERRPACADFLGGWHFHDDFRRHHRVRAAIRPHDLAIRCRQGHGSVRCVNGVRIVRLLHLAELLDAAALRHSVRLGRGWRRCGAQQLCGNPLRKPSHELAARHVGLGHAAWPVHHGKRIGCRPWLGVGLPDHLHSAGRAYRGAGAEPAVVEGA